MKFVVAAVCFMALATFAQGLSTTDILKAIRECKQENNCNENLLQILKENGIPTTKEGLKSMYCAGKKIELIKADNTIDEAVMKTILEKSHMDSNKIPQVITACKSKCTGADEADAMKSLITCLKSQ